MSCRFGSRSFRLKRNISCWIISLNTNFLHKKSKLNQNRFTVVNKPHTFSYFKLILIIFYPDDSFIFSSKTSYQYSGLGVSDQSSFDRTLFKVNADRKIEWITTYDFHNNSDQEATILNYNDLIYFGFPSGIQDHYYCITTNLASTGEVLQNKWYFKDSSSIVNGRKFLIIFISEYHISKINFILCHSYYQLFNYIFTSV